MNHTLKIQILYVDAKVLSKNYFDIE